MVENKENQFEGFSAETVFFLKNLKENNNREWFLARKKDYSKKVLQPAALFVLELGEMLQKTSPGVQADPKINRSICRINRDTRFANVQEPYRTFLGIRFWEGKRKTKDSPDYYFELRPEEMYLSAGMQSFSRKTQHLFRKAVDDSKSGAELIKIINKIRENPDYQLNEAYYKNIPEGYTVNDEQQKDLIRFNHLMVSTVMPIPPELYNKNLLKLVFAIYKDWSPLYNWLTQYVYNG